MYSWIARADFNLCLAVKMDSQKTEQGQVQKNFFTRRQNTQYNGTQHIDIHHDNTQQNDI